MTDFQKFMVDSLIWTEGFAAITALLYFRKVKNTYWKYFVIYLVLIFLFEMFGKWGENLIDYPKHKYYNYIVIPFEFIFFYWLFASKSLKKEKIFWIFSSLYLLSFIPGEVLFKEYKIFNSFNYTFGSLLLTILVIMEYYQQINSANILDFSKNRMFYINLGVTLFYIGTLPAIAFYSLLREYKEIWDIYFPYFLVSGCIMYLLFSISFIWGKQNS